MALDPLDDVDRLMRRYAIEPATVRAIVGELRQAWGGSSAYIKAIDRPGRNAEIAALLQSGNSVDTIARQARTSPATVRRVRREWPA